MKDVTPAILTSMTQRIRPTLFALGTGSGRFALIRRKIRFAKTPPAPAQAPEFWAIILNWLDILDILPIVGNILINYKHCLFFDLTRSDWWDAATDTSTRGADHGEALTPP